MTIRSPDFQCQEGNSANYLSGMNGISIQFRNDNGDIEIKTPCEGGLDITIIIIMILLGRHVTKDEVEKATLHGRRRLGKI